MAIATTYTLAYFLRVAGFHIYGVYFLILGFITVKGNEEIDVAKEVQDFMIMTSEHVTFYEGGPLGYRILALTLDIFFITEE